MNKLETIFTTCFNDLIQGNYTVTLSDEDIDIKYNAVSALSETRNTIWYEWCSSNNRMYIVEDMFDHILKPITSIDLKGFSSEEVTFMISPETKRLKGIKVPNIVPSKSDKEALEYYDKMLNDYNYEKSKVIVIFYYLLLKNMEIKKGSIEDLFE